MNRLHTVILNFGLTIKLELPIWIGIHWTYFIKYCRNGTSSATNFFYFPLKGNNFMSLEFIFPFLVNIFKLLYNRIQTLSWITSLNTGDVIKGKPRGCRGLAVFTGQWWRRKGEAHEGSHVAPWLRGWTLQSI